MADLTRFSDKAFGRLIMICLSLCVVPLEETILSSSCYNQPAKVFDLKQSDHHFDAKKSILTSLTSTNYQPLVKMMCLGICLAFTLTLLWSFPPLCFEPMCSIIATKADAVNELKKEMQELKREMKEYRIEMRKSASAMLFKGRDFFLPSAKAPVPAPPEKPGTTQPTTNNCLPSDKTEVDDDVTLAVSQVADEFWQGIANALKVKTLNINYRTADVNLYRVIKNWKLAAKTTPTVGELLKACELNGVDRLAIAEKYKSIMSS